MSTHRIALSAQQLSELLLFRGESPDALEWLLEACTVRTLKAGEVLLSPVQPNDTLYIILSGILRVELTTQGERVHTELDAGHCVGEMSVIDGAPPSAVVIADTDTQLLAIDGNLLWSLINRSHAVARNLLYILSSRVRRDNQAIIASLEQQRVFEQYSHLDALTDLHNRRWLDNTLSRLVERCSIDGQPLSLIILDVDHFKHYNDTYGHLAGDCALRVLADTLQRNIRGNDAAARYGGEEFVVIMPNTNKTDAMLTAERLCGAIRAQPVRDADGRDLPRITVSIGLAALQAEQNSAELLASADAALYRAKHAGRDRVAA